ncbi:IclR family transcriptional regulator [Salipiger sp. P9]|uniref:IclR family transcriptional regulator n=1 Tax=Salipiger pentaromativorans TaxID=2943193 RepID=UPI0021587CA1|nr:IclR family transcriptional regulator [Salipiger pentaromativorans]MCR8550612.1 IclR family transcriptional regulator [Salipiger pentaromativorans]
MTAKPAAVKKPATKSEGRGVQSIEIGARLLAALAEEVEPMMLKDLAQVAGFAPAQAHAYLVSYRNIGIVEQDADTGRYRLGRFALDLGIARLRTTDPMRMAAQAVIDLSERTALNVALVVWGSFGPTVVQVQESGSQLNMNTRPGTVYSMSSTASGRMFAGFLPEVTVKDAIAREKREKPGSGRVGVPRFISRKEIEQIREAGYATVEQPPVPGLSAYSAPVFDSAGEIILGITIIGQDFYLEDRAESEFIPALLETTRGLSAELGYLPAR